jgi:hypothetical protein
MYDENGIYDTALQEVALRLIIANCPGQAAAAADALRSRSDAGRQARLDRIAPIALRDEGAWDDIGRELLARAMSGPGTDSGPAEPDVSDVVEAVLDVLAPRADTVWFIDQDPAEPPRVPIIRLEYQGQAVMPNDEQMRDLARAIVAAVRTASAPRTDTEPVVTSDQYGLQAEPPAEPG